VRLVSLNTNKGLNGDRRELLDPWLRTVGADVLAVQEPVAVGKDPPARINDLVLAGGNDCVAVYFSPSVVGSTEIIDERWLRARIGDLVLDNVYLPYESKTARQKLFERLALRPAQRRLIVGDFNMAPRPEDGRYGDSESAWTGARERRAFQAILAGGLSDLTASLPPEFTFERWNRGDWTRFRCDLALATASVRGMASGDHSVRAPKLGFTDHSAVVVDLDL